MGTPMHDMETEAMRRFCRRYRPWLNKVSDDEMWHEFNSSHTDSEWRLFYGTFVTNLAAELWAERIELQKQLDEVPNCDDCERIDPDNPPEYDEP